MNRRQLLTAETFNYNTAILEGNNRKFGLIRRKTCGFYDIKYFILKIFQADNPLPIPLPVP